LDVLLMDDQVIGIVAGRVLARRRTGRVVEGDGQARPGQGGQTGCGGEGGGAAALGRNGRRAVSGRSGGAGHRGPQPGGDPFARIDLMTLAADQVGQL